MVWVVHCIDFYCRNTSVDLTHIDTPPNMAAWPHFHNGVAAGLRLANSSQVCIPGVDGCINWSVPVKAVFGKRLG